MTQMQFDPSAGVRCRFCGHPLEQSVADLGMTPLSNAYLRRDQLAAGETFYPLHARVCDRCWLVQVEEFEAPEQIFGDYAYFSSYSESWLEHCRAYARRVIQRFGLREGSFVAEVASNDGYLLRNFLGQGFHVLGIEPAANVARVAEAAGIPTLVRFFGSATAREVVAERGQADLVVGNNVLAHVPGLNDFVAGLRILLRNGGVITMEFPHLLRLLEGNQFDTIYHEHFSYFSLTTVEEVFRAHELTIFDVEELPTHGGSLRIYARHAEDAGSAVAAAVVDLREREAAFGITDRRTYAAFGERVKASKRRLLEFLMGAAEQGQRVVGYGAAAKGNTLLNYCGVGADFLEYVVDRSPHKQGRFLPGTRLPIEAPERVLETRPEYLLILPWNLKAEIMEQMSGVRDWGGRFVVPIPEVEIYP